MYMFKKAYLTVVLILAAVPFSFGQTSDEVVSLLYEIDDRSTKFGNEIVFIEEFNFGIPGVKNWLVEWEEEMTIENEEERVYRISMIYVVDVALREILFREQFDAVINLKRSNPYASYYENLPGQTIGNGGFQVGDFNGEGFDMILYFNGGAGGPSVDISAFVPENGRIEQVFTMMFD